MIKVTNEEVWLAKEALQEVIKEPWPVKVAYGFAKLSRRIDEQFAVIEVVRNGLVNKYGEKNDKGQTEVKRDSENYAEFAAEFNALLAEHCDIECAKIVLPDQAHLPEDRQIRVKPANLASLEPFIELGEPSTQ